MTTSVTIPKTAITLTPSQTARALETLLLTKRPVYVHGSPGISKSDTVKAVGAKLGREIIDIRAVLLDPVDLRGIPHVNGDKRAHWCPPSFLPYEDDSTAIIFLDELSQAAPMVQAACLQLCLDRRLGEYVLPKGCSIIAAGNKRSDRAGAQRLITPLLNRFVHIEMAVDVDEWLRWADQSGIDTRIRSFIAWRKADALMGFRPDSDEMAFPTPRSWHFASDVIQAARAVEMPLVAGCVGAGAAAEFVGFCDLYHKLPKIEAILKDPARHEIPTDEPAVMYALMGSLTEHFKKDASAAEGLATYIVRAPAEFAFLGFRMMGALHGMKIGLTKAGSTWRRENAGLILD